MPTKRAYEIDPGKMVSFPIAGEMVICLKALRRGRDFLHHYLVPLDGEWRAPGLALIYVDPEQELMELENPPGLALGVGETSRDAAVGEIFANSNGHFLKVLDTDKTQRLYAYVEIKSGDVRIRQERTMKEIFPSWRLDAG
jgi:hypothetical protein